MGKFGTISLAMFILITVIIANSAHISTVAKMLRDIDLYVLTDSHREVSKYKYNKLQELLM